MKLKPYFTALLVFGLAVVAVVYAQQIRLPDASAMLNQATAMLAQGKPQDALALLAKIPATDVGYGQAKGYDALCLYALKDGKKFLQAVDKPEVQAAKLPAAIREELDFAQIDTLFSIGKFSEAAHKALDFQENHPGSEQSGNVMEHLSAALFTQGMRDVYRACSLKDDQQFKSSWLRGQSNLVQFQTVAAALGKTGYQILPKRDLRTEVWTARIALGDETNVLREIAGQSRGDMEEALFMNVELHQRLQPRAADENLRRMTNFLAQFPKTKHSKRVMFDMANVALEEGWRLAWQSKPDKAATYLDMARALFSGVAVDKEADMTDLEVIESRIGTVRAFYAKQDYAGLTNWVTQIVANLPAGEKYWLVFKLYDAAALACQTNATAAAGELDELLATGFKGNPSYDGLLVSAAKWRIRVAKMTGDQPTIRRMAELVQNSGCYDSLKGKFAQDFKELVAEPNPLSK